MAVTLVYTKIKVGCRKEINRRKLFSRRKFRTVNGEMSSRSASPTIYRPLRVYYLCAKSIHPRNNQHESATRNPPFGRRYHLRR